MERHLRTHGHLPDYGCCEYDQVIEVGDTVSFAHEDVHRKVLKVDRVEMAGRRELMIEIENMAGSFNASIFRKINYKQS